ncbi:hypothetical protein D3C87_1771950 [compost metagenome]
MQKNTEINSGKRKETETKFINKPVYLKTGFILFKDYDLALRRLRHLNLLDLRCLILHCQIHHLVRQFLNLQY